jgi:copper/silver efflux system protein
VAVGFIALFGVAVETGVLMIAYLNHSIALLVAERGNDRHAITPEAVQDAVFRGATPRVRPLLMTVLANILGMIPILLSSGTGSDVMKPITIPFVFGLMSSTLFVLIVLPIIFQLVKEHELRKHGRLSVLNIKED